MKNIAQYAFLPVLTILFLGAETAAAHDPVFGLGPHTLYKGGVEIHAGGHREKSGDESETEAELQFKYGLTGDWVAGIGIPYVRSGDVDDRWGSTNLSTKYRFWRHDSFGVQESMAVLGKVMLDDGEGLHGVEPDGNERWPQKSEQRYKWIACLT